MNDDLEQYRQVDWLEVAAKVANFTRRVLSARGWSGELLPTGESPEDITYQAINEFWQEPHRKPPGCSLTTFLCGLARHKVWNLLQLSETKSTARTDELESIAGQDTAFAPDAASMVHDDFSTAITLLAEHPKVKGKPDHELDVTALGCGAFDPDELEKETRLTRSRIYQVQRELNDIYPDIRKNIQSKKGAKP